MHYLCILSLVMLTIILEIVLVWFLQISYHTPLITIKVIVAYKDEDISNILV